MDRLDFNKIIVPLTIILGSIIAITLIFLVLFFLIRKKLIRDNFKKYSAKLVYNIALDNDFYLINDLLLPLNDEEHMHIDHLLFGEKYIYLISSRKYSYQVKGGEYDNSWVYLNNKKIPEFIDNPVLMNKKRIEKLSMITNIKLDYIIGIVLTNDEAYFDNKISDESNLFVPYSKLRKTIKKFETKPVKKINNNDLAMAVKDLAKLNDR